MCRGNESAIRKAPGPRTKAYAPYTPAVNSAAGTGSDAKEAGLGISIMPRMLLRKCTAGVKIYPIQPDIPPIYLIRRSFIHDP